MQQQPNKMCATDSIGNAANGVNIEKDDQVLHVDNEYRNNAQNVLKLRVEMTASAKELRIQIEKIIQILCPFLFPDGEDASLRIKPLTGGLSNRLYLISNPDLSKDGNTAGITAVLVRIHPDEDGEGSESGEEAFSIVDRECETKFAAWLASQREDLPHNRGNMAPTMYGRFENGRVEEFYQNVRPVLWAEMKTYGPLIAQSMASFHTLEPPPEDILGRPPTFDGTGNATHYQTIRAWLYKAHTMPLDDSAKKFLTELSQEWDWLSSTLAKPPKQKLPEGTNSSVVNEALEFIRRISITHMDGQPLNILIENKDNGEISSTLRFIDFEYCGWNPIAADIGNTFCEYCEMTNLCADYEKEYPSPSQQDEFFWRYLVQSNSDRAKQFACYSWREEDGNVSTDCVWELFSATLQQEVGRFSLLSHLGWAIWSIVRSQEDDGIDFDYIFYARHRMEGYEWAKKKFGVE